MSTQAPDDMEISINILIHRYLKDHQFHRSAKEFEYECKYFKKIDMSSSVNGEEFLMPKLQNIIIEYCALKKAEYEMQKGGSSSINTLWQQFDSLTTQINTGELLALNSPTNDLLYEFLTVGKQPKTTLINRGSSVNSYKRVLAAVSPHIQVNSGQVQLPRRQSSPLEERPATDPLQNLRVASDNHHCMPVPLTAEERLLKSPKRKRIRPKKLDSSESKDQRQEPVTSCRNGHASSDATQNAPVHGELNAIFDTLLNSRSLQEKIANNINKVATSSHLPQLRIDRDFSLEKSHQTVNVEEVLNMTRSDPSFESLFSILDDLEIGPVIQTPMKEQEAPIPAASSQFPEFHAIESGGFSSVRLSDSSLPLPSTTDSLPQIGIGLKNERCQDSIPSSVIESQCKGLAAADHDTLQGTENQKCQSSSLCNLYIKQTRRTRRRRPKDKKSPKVTKGRSANEEAAQRVILSGTGAVSNLKARDLWKSDFVPNVLQRNLKFTSSKDFVSPFSSSDVDGCGNGASANGLSSNDSSKLSMIAEDHLARCEKFSTAAKHIVPVPSHIGTVTTCEPSGSVFGSKAETALFLSDQGSGQKNQGHVVGPLGNRTVTSSKKSDIESSSDKLHRMDTSSNCSTNCQENVQHTFVNLMDQEKKCAPESPVSNIFRKVIGIHENFGGPALAAESSVTLRNQFDARSGAGVEKETAQDLEESTFGHDDMEYSMLDGTPSLQHHGNKADPLTGVRIDSIESTVLEEASQNQRINVNVIFENTIDETLALMKPVQANGAQELLQSVFVTKEMPDGEVLASDECEGGNAPESVGLAVSKGLGARASRRLESEDAIRSGAEPGAEERIDIHSVHGSRVNLDEVVATGVPEELTAGSAAELMPRNVTVASSAGEAEKWVGDETQDDHNDRRSQTLKVSERYCYDVISDEKCEALKKRFLMSMQASLNDKVGAANNIGKSSNVVPSQPVQQNEDSLDGLGFKVTSSELVCAESKDPSSFIVEIMEKGRIDDNGLYDSLPGERRDNSSRDCMQRTRQPLIEPPVAVLACTSGGTNDAPSREHETPAEEKVDVRLGVGHFQAIRTSSRHLQERKATQEGSASSATELENDQESGTLNRSKVRKNSKSAKRKRKQPNENANKIQKEQSKKEKTESVPADVLKGINIDQFLAKLQYSNT